jgi:hypothetical protein
MQEEMQEDAHDEANCDKSHEGISGGENAWFPFQNKMVSTPLVHRSSQS